MLLGCQLGVSLFYSTKLSEVLAEKLQPLKVFTEQLAAMQKTALTG